MAGYKDPPKEHQWKKGQSGNAGGRPKDTMKEYVRKKLAGMSQEEREIYLKEIPKDLQWKMAEGSPHQTQDTTVEVTLPKPLLDGLSNVSTSNNSNPKATETEEKD